MVMRGHSAKERDVEVGDLQGKYLRHFSSRKSSTVWEEEEEEGSLVPCPGSQAHWVEVGVMEDKDEIFVWEA